jgi:hypothetical protein
LGVFLSPQIDKKHQATKKEVFVEDNQLLLDNKINELEKALIIKNDTSEKFQLKEELKELKELKITTQMVSGSCVSDIKIFVGCSNQVSLPIKPQLEQAQTQRLKQIIKGQNPYSPSYEALPFESPVFVGRERELSDIFTKYNHPQHKPASINIVGERRIGKTSLLNQLFYYLKQQDKLVLIYFSAQAWRPSTAHDFFSVLLMKLSTHFGENYEDFETLLNEQAQQGFRFLLIIEEFEEFCNNSFVNAAFLSKLRSLADNPSYSMGYLLISRLTIYELQKQHKTESSSFHGIFDNEFMGLLKPKEVQILTEQIWALSTDKSPLNQQYIEKIEQYAGQHPLLLQIVLYQIWQHLDNKEEINWRTIRRKCNERYADWWERCNAKEKQVLLDSTKENILDESDTYNDLHDRNLLLNGKPFCEEFSAFILRK